MTDLAFPKVTGRSSRQRKAAREKEAEAFRRAVWLRDGGRCRATGQAVMDPRTAKSLDESGSVCHLKSRRVMPEWKVDPKRAVLMSERMHILSDHRGGNALKLTDPLTGDPATDGDKPIVFTLSDRKGYVQWMRIG